MKKELLIVALGLLGTATYAQNSAKVLSGNTKLEQKITTELNDQSSVKYLNQASQFFNNHTVTNTSKSSAGGNVNIRANYQSILYDLFGGNATFDLGFVTVFPDTAIMQEGTSAGGGTSYFRPSNHGLVYIYDPQSELFGNDQNTGVENYFSAIDPVNVDSIFTAGIYFINNTLATTDRLRFDIVTGYWGSGPFVDLSGVADVDADLVNDTISLQGLRIIGSNSNGVPSYNLAGATTVFRTLTPADTGKVVDFGVGLNGIQIPSAGGGLGVIITYEPTTGSYTPNMDTVSLNDNTGNTNIFRSLIALSNDPELYWLQYTEASNQYFNHNIVGGFISPDERYNTSANTFSNTYLRYAHSTSARVSGVSHVSVTELENNSGNFSVYPNPSNGDFNLKLEGFKGDDTYTVTVMNILGQTVHEEVVTMSNGVKSFSLSDVEKGLYLVNINSENLNVVQKITIK